MIAMDNDLGRLAALDQVKASYVAQRAGSGVSTGHISTLCADLTAKGWPFPQASVSAIICVHFAMLDLIPTFLSSIQKGGYLYVETFGGQGQNFRDLPRAEQLRELLSTHVEFKYYKERKVGPTKVDSVAVTLFAQKQ
jgi:hypothetical protein